ncbi:MAG: alpha/beta fold hydrolase, partial [Bacteroidales bacterium]|nr:alpha/beta fold hydrolase [Bacteroidales bacterium]
MKQLLILSILFFSLSSLKSQNKQSDNTIIITTKDGVKISAFYKYKKTQLAFMPAVILIHQGGSSKKEWLALALLSKLIEEGYAVLAYDVRQHGASGKDKGTLYDLFNNPNRAPLDLLAVIAFLKKEKNIDSNRIGILGASIGANLACAASASDKYTIKSIVSLSAKTDAVQNLSGLKEIIHPKNAFYIASKGDQKGMRVQWAKELYNLTTDAKQIKIVA